MLSILTNASWNLIVHVKGSLFGPRIYTWLSIRHHLFHLIVKAVIVIHIHLTGSFGLSSGVSRCWSLEWLTATSYVLLLGIHHHKLLGFTSLIFTILIIITAAH